MTARRVKEKVQKDYVRHVRTFAAFLGRSPDTATSEDLRRFQVHLARQEIGVATINAAISALRFFFNVTLERPRARRNAQTIDGTRAGLRHNEALCQRSPFALGMSRCSRPSGSPWSRVPHTRGDEPDMRVVTWT